MLAACAGRGAGLRDQAWAIECFLDIAQDGACLEELQRTVGEGRNAAERVVLQQLGVPRRQRVELVRNAFLGKRHAHGADIGAAAIAIDGDGTRAAFGIHIVAQAVEYRLPAAGVRIACGGVREAGVTHVQERAAVLVSQGHLDQRAGAFGQLATFPLPGVGQEIGAVDLLVLAADHVLRPVTATHHKPIAPADPCIGAGFQHAHAARAMPGRERRLVRERIEDPFARRANLAGHLQMKRSCFGHDLNPLSSVTVCACSTKATSLSRLSSQCRRYVSSQPCASRSAPGRK